MSYIHFPVIAVMGQFLAAFLVAIFGSKSRKASQAITLIASACAFVLVCLLIKPVALDGQIISYWMGNWEPVSGYAIGIGYEMDALGLFFAVLVSFIILMSAIYSLRYLEHDEAVDRYYTLFLMLSGSLLGLVMTGDLFNMFIMIEIMTFSAVGLTAFRNYIPEALEAAMKYLVIGSVGSSMTLAGVALLYAQTHTLNMAQVAAKIGAMQASGGLTPTVVFAFGLMFVGFGIKSFMFPFHTPVADAHPVAPTSFSMVFSTMVIKAGVYGLIRIAYIVFQVMDKSSVQILITAFGCVTMFLGVTMALAQHDFKRLLAFHSISQIGYIITALGLGTALGLTGSLFHVMNHTLFKALLFMCAGAVLHMTGSKNLDELGGLSKKMPHTTICFLIAAFSIAGIPPFNGFASKWMIYQATYEKAVESGNFFYALVTVVAVVVSVLTLASFIKVTMSVFFGQLPEKYKDAKEAPASMLIPMWITAILCLGTGVLYQLVDRTLTAPAVAASLTPANYVDKMMGSGYAASFSVKDAVATAVQHMSYWNPVLWLTLLVIVMLGVFIVILSGDSERGPVLKTKEPVADGKYATFFSGEKYRHSHMGGSDLFWGFKHDMKPYFDFIEEKHSGVLTDYTLWTIVAMAVIVVYTFVFVK